MFPREIICYIFSFQEMYRYFLISNTLHSLKKIKETLCKFHPTSVRHVKLPITKTKYYQIVVYVNYFYLIFIFEINIINKYKHKEILFFKYNE